MIFKLKIPLLKFYVFFFPEMELDLCFFVFVHVECIHVGVNRFLLGTKKKNKTTSTENV